MSTRQEVRHRILGDGRCASLPQIHVRRATSFLRFGQGPGNENERLDGRNRERRAEEVEIADMRMEEETNGHGRVGCMIHHQQVAKYPFGDDCRSESVTSHHLVVP